jgi:hypothetical protein
MEAMAGVVRGPDRSMSPSDLGMDRLHEVRGFKQLSAFSY